jgi:hypothetical protein
MVEAPPCAESGCAYEQRGQGNIEPKLCMLGTVLSGEQSLLS